MAHNAFKTSIETGESVGTVELGAYVRPCPLIGLGCSSRAMLVPNLRIIGPKDGAMRRLFSIEHNFK